MTYINLQGIWKTKDNNMLCHIYSYPLRVNANKDVMQVIRCKVKIIKGDYRCIERGDWKKMIAVLPKQNVFLKPVLFNNIKEGAEIQILEAVVISC